MSTQAWRLCRVRKVGPIGAPALSLAITFVMGGSASQAIAQSAAAPVPATASQGTASQGDDADMPADLGAPLASVDPQAASAPSDAAAPGRAETAEGVLSVDMPIAIIASAPNGRAVLDRDLPGLCERPEYSMFKTMSLKKLARMSGGRITSAKLERVQADLAQASNQSEPAR